MTKTIIRRLLIMIPQLIVISLFIFFLAENMPGDALTGLISPDIHPSEIEAMREALGFNRPWPERYLEWIFGVLQGDFGWSFQHVQPVINIVGERLANTVWLGIVALFFQYSIAIPLGVLAGKNLGKPIDRIIVVYSFLSLAMPTILMGIIMLFWLSPVGWGWFPLGGSVNAIVLSSGDPVAIFFNRLHHLILPALSIALASTAGIIFYLRSNIVERRNSDYVTLARSKGVPERVIFGKHIFRNSLIPIASDIGIAIVGVLTGSILIERIFNFPGIGQLFLTSITQRDFAVANFLIMFLSMLSVIGVLISDIVLTLVDPRIRIK
ncbi:MAG: ABC transporter permease [Defluviitaleaceae bacterium]|nr:ABC transporter permease [Defluviitaleaceae bacterium]